MSHYQRYQFQRGKKSIFNVLGKEFSDIGEENTLISACSIFLPIRHTASFYNSEFDLPSPSWIGDHASLNGLLVRVPTDILALNLSFAVYQSYVLE